VRQHVAEGTPITSHVKAGASLDALRRNASQSSNLGSPVKAKSSPAKNGVWDSLFQYEISLQGGKKKA
jgi:hypothetical protein